MGDTSSRARLARVVTEGAVVDRLAMMETFVTVIETGSFSAAARRLEVGQPAVSKSIAQLEARLDTRLLIRSTRGLTPTEAGQAFYERARRAIEEADEADLAARGAGAGLAGRLRICAPVTFARLHIVPQLGRFLAMHPQINIDVVLDDRNVDLLEEGIDVALRLGELADSTMTARRIASGRRAVIGTVDYLARFGEPASPAQLADHQVVIYSRGAGESVWPFRRNDAEELVQVGGRLRLSAAEGVRAAVLADLGLVVASEWMFGPELASGRVVRVLTDWTLPAMDLWAVFPTGRMASAKSRAFIAFVEEVFTGSPQA